MAGYIGSSTPVVSSGSERKYQFTATASQTTFSPVSYMPGQVHVFQNGVRLREGVDYSATTGNSIVLTTGATENDEVVIISYATFQVSDTYTKGESDARFASAPDTYTKGEIDTTQFLPTGLVWMYDGTGWIDNVTLPGWYACVPENAAQGCPNMVDRFVMGKTIAVVGVTGGANSYSLTAGQLPAHTHTINHDHGTFTSGSNNSGHSHYTSGVTSFAGSHTHTIPTNFRSNGSTDRVTSDPSSGELRRVHSTDSDGLHTHSWSGTSGGQSANHTHSVSIPSFSGNSGSTGSGDSIDNRPAFYSMLFIRKCS